MDVVLKYFSEFSPTQMQQLQGLEAAYKEWNEKINVISRKDIDSLYEKHVLHSLAITAVFDFSPGMEIIDIGTGGGFPGIPLAIFYPDVKFHLVDSIAKKLKVVQAVADAVGLKNVTTQHTRAEEIKNRRFDFAVSRAVAPLKDLWNWSKPLVRSQNEEPDITQGLICLKGGDLAIEIQESGTRPIVYDIDSIFQEEFFKEKYIVYVPKK